MALRAASLAGVPAGTRRRRPSRSSSRASIRCTSSRARWRATAPTSSALVPPGVEPHDWEPSPQDVVQVQRARVFVYNGAGFEPWVDKLLTDVPGGGTPWSWTRPSGLAARRPSARAVDPHVWLDPVLAQAQVDADPRRRSRRPIPRTRPPTRDNARRLPARLAALDEAFAAGLRDCARRDIVISHAAFAYLARRYRLTQVPVMGLAPEAEPSPAELAAIAGPARGARTSRYIFFETLVSPRLAETLAREIGARTLVLNPIEGAHEGGGGGGQGLCRPDGGQPRRTCARGSAAGERGARSVVTSAPVASAS